MSIEYETTTLTQDARFPFDLKWRVPSEYLQESQKTTFEIPEGTRVCEIVFRDKSVSLILPDKNLVGYDEKNYFEDKRATKLSRKIFQLNNEAIGVAQSYEEELKDRKEIVSIIREKIPGISPNFLDSMRRSFVMRSYNREKRIKQTDDNNPLKIIRELTSNILYSDEPDNLIKERKSKDSAAVFDKFLGRIFRNYLRQIDEAVKIKMGGIEMLKNGYEYYLAEVTEKLLKSVGLENVGNVKSLEYITGLALIKQQIDINKIRIRHAVSSKETNSSEIDKINNEPLVSLEKSIEFYVKNQTVYSSY